VYALFGIDESYQYMARTLGEDPAPLIEAGTCSDDWLKRVVPGAFSLVTELPYYTSPVLEDTTPAGVARREAVEAGIARAERLHGECAAAFDALRAPLPEHRLTRSVRDYLAKTPKRLAAERANAVGDEYSREATRAEALDATTCRAFYHLVYLGEVFRLAELTHDAPLAGRLRERVATLAADIERESQLRVLPVRPLVAVQAGAGLLAIRATHAAA
jgi:hypothetical protein